MSNRFPNWSTAIRLLFERRRDPDMEYLPIPLLVTLCLTLGLAPFVPEPHPAKVEDGGRRRQNAR